MTPLRMTKILSEDTYNLISEFQNAFAKQYNKSTPSSSKNMRQGTTVQDKHWLDLHTEVIEKTSFGESMINGNTQEKLRLIEEIQEREISINNIMADIATRSLSEKEALQLLPKSSDLKEIANELDERKATSLATLVRKKAHERSL